MFARSAASPSLDLAVRHGDGNWPGHEMVRLSPEQLFAVCSPKLLTGRSRLTKPSDVLKFPLIYLDDRKDWTHWLEAAGVVGAELPHGPVLNRGKHGHRCGNRRAGHRVGTYHAGCNRSHQRPTCAPVCRGAAPRKNLLDRLPKGYVGGAQDRGLPRLAAGGSSKRHASAEEARDQGARFTSADCLSDDVVRSRPCRSYFRKPSQQLRRRGL